MIRPNVPDQPRATVPPVGAEADRPSPTEGQSLDLLDFVEHRLGQRLDRPGSDRLEVCDSFRMAFGPYDYEYLIDSTDRRTSNEGREMRTRREGFTVEALRRIQ